MPSISCSSSPLPNITDSVTINGHGNAPLKISGNNQRRVFTVDPGVTANLSGMTITRGNANDLSPDGGLGGGIYNRGALTVSASDAQLQWSQCLRRRDLQRRHADRQLFDNLE